MSTTSVKSVLAVRHLSKPIYLRNAFGTFGSDGNEELFVNGKARSRARVLIVKDSFANPVAGFLSTVCKEVVKVDPRGSPSPRGVLELVEKHRPDVVVMAVNPKATRDAKFLISPAAAKR